MESDIAAMIREGVAAFKAGRRDEAFALLNRVTELDERNEDAWLWLSAVVQSPEDQQICLENVLAINPDNVRAQRGLAAVEQKLAELRAAAVIPPGGGLDDETIAEDAEQAALHQAEDGGWQDAARPGGRDEQELFGVADAAEDDQLAFDRDRTAAAGYDPFAVPQVSPLAYDTLADDEEPDRDDEFFYGDEFAEDEDVPAAEPMPQSLSDDYRDEAALASLLDELPPDIKPTHLPGKGAAYPSGLLISLGLLGVGIVVGLVALLLQLLL